MPRRQGIHTDGHMVQHIVSADDPADSAAEMRHTRGSPLSRKGSAGRAVPTAKAPRKSYFFILQLQPVHRAAVGHIDKSTVARVAHIRVIRHGDNGPAAHDDSMERILLRSDACKLA